MAKVSPIQNLFNAGELSPLLYGRTDFEKYKAGLKTCLNAVVLTQGPWVRRPGTYSVASVKDPSKRARLVRFEFSTTQAYILEFGDYYFRVYKDHGQVVSGGSPVEVTTPWTEAEVAELKFAQSADVIYATHRSHKPRKISRTSHTAWTIAEVEFTDGPYLTTNPTETELSANDTQTSSTVTASAVTGINNDQGFLSTDVGRQIRAKRGGDSHWAWGEITAVNSTTEIVVSWTDGNASLLDTASWRLGMYSETTGWPAAVGFYQDRLVFAGSASSPQSVEMTETGLYGRINSFAPSDADGTIAADNGLSFTLNSNDVQVIRWVLPDEKGLLVGTVSGEWLLGPNTSTEAFGATNVKANETSRHGSADIQAIRPGKAALFVQRAKRKMRELAYVYEKDGFNSPDLTVLSEHVTLGGIVEMAWQQEPYSLVWAPRTDGALLCLVYNREQGVVGWSRNVLGGYSNAARTAAAVVESVACIPAPDGSYDELWLIVRRYVDGAVRRQIEYMTVFRDPGDAQEDAFFVDSGLTYDGVAVSSVSGLDHLEGETVQILADGARQADQVVAGGQVTISPAASVVQVGLGYDSDGQTLRNNDGAADGTAQGKTQRTHRVTFRLQDVQGFHYGSNFTTMFEATFRTDVVALGDPVPLFTGDHEINPWPGEYTSENLICWRISGPFPGMVLAIMPQQNTQDR